jgi:hypothetical protein
VKAFWALIVVLLAAGAALLFLGKPSTTPQERAQTTAAPIVAPIVASSTTTPSTPAPSNAAATPTRAEAAHPSPTPAKPLDRFEAHPTPRPDVQPSSPAPSTPSADVGASKPALAAPGAHAPGHTGSAAQSPAAAAAASGGAGKATSLKDYEIEPGDIKPQPDGTTLVDGRYTIKGDGSEANPFRVPWEMLVSANEVFDPSKSLNKIPQRIAMLEGKHVRLTGYVAFPLMVQRPRELLSMLNQWDGCCIGVPPTPYDAVEVKLKKAVGNKERFANAGMVQGVFRTEPYVVKNWLVGLYVLADASFTPVDAGEDPTGEASPPQ